jgi:hypothetical protein
VKNIFCFIVQLLEITNGIQWFVFPKSIKLFYFRQLIFKQGLQFKSSHFLLKP